MDGLEPRRSGRARTAPAPSLLGVESDGEGDDEPVSSEDEEELKAAAKAKRKAPGSTAPKAPRRKKVPAGATGTDADGLFAVLKSHGGDLTTAATEWAARYESASPAALAELYTFVLKCSGADVVVSAQEVASQSLESLVEALAESIANSTPGEEPLSWKGKEGVRFRASLTDFWEQLVAQLFAGQLAREAVGEALGNVLGFVTAFSGSNVRPLRLGATASGLALAAALVAAVRRAAAARDTAQRQKSASGASGARTQAAKEALAAAQSDVQALEGHLTELYTKLFTHRFRDSDPLIRSDSICALGAWVSAYPPLFLKDYYLKYLGWALNDKNDGVRCAAAKALAGAYGAPERAAAMDSFMARFAPRIVQMAAQDVSHDVCAAAVRLLGALNGAGKLPADGAAAVLAALLDDSQVLRCAAADVVPALLAPRAAASGEVDGAEEGVLPGVLRILCDGPERPGAAQAALDALWDSLPGLRDWEALVGACGGGGGRGAAGERAATEAVRLLGAACRRLAAPEAGFTGGSVSRPRGTKAAKDAASRERGALSTCLLTALPKLLQQHGAHPQRAGELADCARCMASELYALKRSEQGFAALLAALQGAFFKQRAPGTLAALARAMHHAEAEGPPALRAAAAQTVQAAVASLAQRLKKLLPPVAAGDEPAAAGRGRKAAAAAARDDDPESQLELQLALARLRALQDAGTCVRSAGLAPLFQSLLDSPARCLKAGDAALSLAASNAVDLLLHQLAQLGDGDDGGDVSQAMEALVAERDAMIDCLARLHGAASQQRLKRCAFASLCDLLWAFSAPKLRAKGPPLRRLAYSPPLPLLQALWATALRALPAAGATAASQGLFSQEIDAAEAEAEEEEEEGGGEEEGSESLTVPSDDLAPSHLLVCCARLLLHQLLPAEGSEWLAGQLASLWCGHGAAAAELAKRACAHARKCMPAAYGRVALQALQAGFERHAADEWSAESGAALRELAHKLAGSFASGANAMALAQRAACGRLVLAGQAWAMEDGPGGGRLPFLTLALAAFLPKLAASDRTAAAQALEQGAGGAEDPDEEDWAPFYAFRALLQPGSAAKPLSGSKRARSKAKPKVRRAKRLPFGAASQGTSDSDHSEPEDAAEDVEEPDDVAGEQQQQRIVPPASLRAAVTARGRAARAPSPPPSPLAEDEVEDEEEPTYEDALEEQEPVAAPRAARPQRERLFEEEEPAEDASDDELPTGFARTQPAAKKARR